jgi:catechol 2,3-dioxygenase
MTPGARPTPLESTRPDALAFGPVHLDVTDLRRSAEFWRDGVGLGTVAHEGPGCALGAGGRTLVVLHPGARAPASRGHSGLYHLALHVPDEAAFADALIRISRRGIAHAPTDHITHWATYLTDPDGIQVEIAFETIDRVSRYESGPDWPVITDADGNRRHAVEPLDMEPVLVHATGDTDAPIPGGTVVGHLHLHVHDLDVAQEFYSDVLGFTRNVAGPRLGFADLSLGGPFPHRLAVNTWQRPGAPPPPGAAGMRHALLMTHDADARDHLWDRAVRAGAAASDTSGAHVVRDPSGNRLSLLPRETLRQ